MKADIKPSLEEIAGNLTTPEFGYFSSMYIKVIMEGVSAMSQGRITAKPIIQERMFSSPERIDSSSLHNIYALFYQDERIAQILIDSWPRVSGERLKKGVEVALKNYPTERCIILGAGMTAFNNVARDKTQYVDIFLGPALPDSYKVY